MPSLRGLGLDPTLQGRLLSEGVASSSTSAAASSGGGTAIRTSQSLLARDPQALANHLAVPLAEALNVRSSVADAITAQSRVGRDAATITGGVSLAIRRAAIINASSTGRKRPRTGEPSEAAAAVGDEDAATGPSTTVRLFHRRRPPPVSVGAVTALDMCIHTAITNASINNGGAASVGTGSAALDQLMAPHPDLADDGPANRIYQSLVLPSNVKVGRIDGNSEEEERFFGGGGKTNNGTSPTEGGGIRLGYVTEVYGPSSVGKTQLALNVAARASVQGWTVHYLAGGGGASSLHPLARRLKSLVQHRMEEYVASNGGEVTAVAIRNAMDRVGFVAVADGHDALSALAGIDRDIASASSSNDKVDGNGVHNSLVIFDSASGCLSSDLFADGDGGVGSALVEDVAFALKRMARTVGSLGSPARCAVLAINGTVGAGVGHKAALGTGWNRAADVQVHFDTINRGDNMTEHQLEEERSSSSSSNIPGLNVTSKRVINATLTRHYGKAVSDCDHDASKNVSIAITRLGISNED